MGGTGTTTISSGGSLTIDNGFTSLQRPLVNQGTATEAAGSYRGDIGGAAYNCIAGGTSFFTDVLPTGIY
ncbi:MAG: hypothetical protein ACM3SU_13300 [Acidobacteriota bacterium]